MESTDAVAALGALAQPVRLELYRALVVAGPAGMTPGTMAEGLGIPAATLSFHLKELAHAGLVRHERSGRHLVYRADAERIGGLIAYLARHCAPATAAGA